MLVTARNSSEGSLFDENQIETLAAMCKQKGADPAELMAAYTAHIRSMLPLKATGAELVAFIEKAVGDPTEPAEMIELYKRKSGRQPSGEPPAEKLERFYQALLSERAGESQNCTSIHRTTGQDP